MVKLSLFESSLDETSRKELQLLQTQKGEVSYVEFYARMKGKSGRDTLLGARKTFDVVFSGVGEVVGGLYSG